MYGLCFNYNLGADSYVHLFNPSITVDQYSATGRPLAAALQWLTRLAGINLVVSQTWTYAISIVFLALAVSLLHCRLLRIRKTYQPAFVVLSFTCSFLIVSNVFVTEWFTYSFVTPITTLAQLLIVLAAIHLSKPELSAGGAFYVVALTTASVCLFQSPASLLPPLSIALTAMTGNRSAAVIHRFLLAAAAYAVGGAASLLYVREIHPRVSPLLDPRSSHLSIMQSAVAVLQAQREVWINSFDILPKYLFLAVTLVAAAMAFRARSERRTGSTDLLIAATVLSMVLFSFTPHLFSAVVWIVPRSVIGLASLPGLLFLFGLWFGSPQGWRSWILTSASIAYLGVNLASGNQILMDHIHTDREDREVGRLVYDRIAQYEQGGIQITKLAFAMDRYPTWCYPEVRCYGDLNVRSWVKPYARLPLLQLVSGRRFAETPFEPHTMVEMFGKDNWNSLSAEQVRCIGDTAYIAVY